MHSTSPQLPSLRARRPLRGRPAHGPANPRASDVPRGRARVPPPCPPRSEGSVPRRGGRQCARALGPQISVAGHGEQPTGTRRGRPVSCDAGRVAVQPKPRARTRRDLRQGSSSPVSLLTHMHDTTPDVRDRAERAQPVQVELASRTLLRNARPFFTARSRAAARRVLDRRGDHMRSAPPRPHPAPHAADCSGPTRSPPVNHTLPARRPAPASVAPAPPAPTPGAPTGARSTGSRSPPSGTPPWRRQLPHARGW